MEEIKKLITNKNFTKEIKCNVIIMLIDTNKSQAKDIIALINQYKEVDNEFATYVIKKISEAGEYNETLEELKIEIKKENDIKDVEVVTNKDTEYDELNEFKGIQNVCNNNISNEHTYSNNPIISSNIDKVAYNTCKPSSIAHLLMSNTSYNLTQNIETFFNHMKKSPILAFYMYKRNKTRTNSNNGYFAGHTNSYNVSNNTNNKHSKYNNTHVSFDVNKMKIPIEFLFYKKSNKNFVNRRHTRKNDNLYVKSSNIFESNDNTINEYHAKRYKNMEHENQNIQTHHAYNNMQANNNYNTNAYTNYNTNAYNNYNTNAHSNYNINAHSSYNRHDANNMSQNNMPQTHSYNAHNYNNYNLQNINNTAQEYSYNYNIQNTNGATYTQHQNINIPSNPTSICSIFTYKLQCTVCGLRFFENDEGMTKMVNHVEEHARKTRNMESNKGRDNFVRYEDFNNTYIKIDLDLVVEEEKSIIIAENASCDICKSKIEKGWDDKIESWILLDCVVIDEVRKKYCHRSCIM